MCDSTAIGPSSCRACWDHSTRGHGVVWGLGCLKNWAEEFGIKSHQKSKHTPILEVPKRVWIDMWHDRFKMLWAGIFNFFINQNIVSLCCSLIQNLFLSADHDPLISTCNDSHDIFDQNVNQEIIDNQGSIAYGRIRKKVPAKAVEISGALELEPKAVSAGPQLGWIRTWDGKIYTWGIPPPKQIPFNEFQQSNLSGQNRSVSFNQEKPVQFTNSVVTQAISCCCLVKRNSECSELDGISRSFSLVHSKSPVHSAMFVAFWPGYAVVAVPLMHHWKDESNPVDSGTNYQAEVFQDFSHQSTTSILVFSIPPASCRILQLTFFQPLQTDTTQNIHPKRRPLWSRLQNFPRDRSRGTTEAVGCLSPCVPWLNKRCLLLCASAKKGSKKGVHVMTLKCQMSLQIFVGILRHFLISLVFPSIHTTNFVSLDILWMTWWWYVCVGVQGAVVPKK